MVIGLLVFGLYLYFFVGFSSLISVLISLNSANYALYYSLAVLAAVLSVFFVAAAWQDLLKTLSVKTKLRSLFLYTWVGYFVDLVVPCQAVCGEVTRIYLVHGENQESYGAVAASSLTNRIISYFMSSVGLLSGIILVLTRTNGVPPLILDASGGVSWDVSLPRRAVLSSFRCTSSGENCWRPVQSHRCIAFEQVSACQFARSGSRGFAGSS